MKREPINPTVSCDAEPKRDAGGISVAGVWASYGDRSVLTGLDLEVEPGTLTAIAGPNGVGKSTLLRLIAGIHRPTRGSVSVAGADASTLPARARARLVAMVPQDPELPPGTAAVEVVMMGRNPHLGLLSWEAEDDLRIAVNAMALTDSVGLLERQVDQLSGGERQRVAIAMALAQQTPVLLLDEPTANLDLAYQPVIMDLLRELVRSGKTVVTAVHDLTLAAQFCDRIAILNDGKLMAAGPPGSVLTPSNIRRAYGVEVRIIGHPDTGKPIVVNAWRHD